MNQWSIRQAATVVMGGGVIAYPTEAVYGLGCDPQDSQAIINLLQIKRRDVAPGLILVGRSLNDFADYIVLTNKILRRVMSSRLQGPVTWLMPASEQCPAWVCGKHSTVGVRVTDHAQTRALCHALGSAIVSTSANRRGSPALSTALQVRQAFADELDYILTGPTGGWKQPSQIIDATSGEVIRGAKKQGMA